jgi:hypothetical protein
VNTLEITIQRKSGDSWPVVLERTQPGSLLPVRNEGKLVFDPADLRRCVDSLDYGTCLGQALFQDPHVRDPLVSALTEVRAQRPELSKEEDFLRLLLFVEDKELCSLHWERLCVEVDNRWDFLCLRQETPFSLYLPSLTDRRFPPIGRRDLRTLLLVANPKGLEGYSLVPFRHEETVARLRAALGEIPCDVLADIEDAVGLPTLPALEERLTQGTYRILHIVCHGVYNASREKTSLFFSGLDRRVDRIEDEALLTRLSRLGSLPHLVFLSSCGTADPRAEQGLGGLAHRMVRELGTPAVIAMTGRVSIETAELLSAHFYQRSYWIPGSYAPMLSEKHNSFLRL